MFFSGALNIHWLAAILLSFLVAYFVWGLFCRLHSLSLSVGCHIFWFFYDIFFFSIIFLIFDLYFLWSNDFWCLYLSVKVDVWWKIASTFVKLLAMSIINIDVPTKKKFTIEFSIVNFYIYTILYLILLMIQLKESEKERTKNNPCGWNEPASEQTTKCQRIENSKIKRRKKSSARKSIDWPLIFSISSSCSTKRWWEWISRDILVWLVV